MGSLKNIKPNLRFYMFSFLFCFSASLFLQLEIGFAKDSALAGKQIKLGLNWKAEPQFGGFFAAKDSEIFKKNGLEVDVIEGGVGTPIVQMVAAGKLEFGIASGDEILLSRERGSDVVALFAVYQTNPQGIMTHLEQGYSTIADVFKGTGKLAIQNGLPYSDYLKNKFGTPKVQLVPYLGGISNFQSDKMYSQQCFVTSEPLIAEKMGLKTKTFLIAESGYNPYTTVLIARKSYIDKNTELTKSMVAAVRTGWEQYLASPDGTNLSMSKINKAMDLATFADSARVQKALIANSETAKVGLGKMTEERWKNLISQLKDLKLLKKPIVAKDVFLNF